MKSFYLFNLDFTAIKATGQYLGGLGFIISLYPCVVPINFLFHL